MPWLRNAPALFLLLALSCRSPAEPTVAVLAADADLPEGAEPSPAELRTVSVPAALATANTLTARTFESIAGKRLRLAVRRGDLLLASYFVAPDQRPSDLVRKKGRSVTLSVSGAENVRAGDKLDLVAVVPDPATREWQGVTLLQNVLVIEPGPLEPAAAGEAFPLRRLSLMVLPEEAELALLAARTGGLHASLRHREDLDVQEERGRATMSTLLTGERLRALEALRTRVLAQRGSTERAARAAAPAPHRLGALANAAPPPPAPAPAARPAAPLPVLPSRDEQ